MGAHHEFSSSLMGGNVTTFEKQPDWISVRCADEDCNRYEGQYCCPALVDSKANQLLKIEEYKKYLTLLIKEYFGKTFFQKKISRSAEKWIKLLELDLLERISRGCSSQNTKQSVLTRSVIFLLQVFDGIIKFVQRP